jgi:hypothetical protein
VDPLRNSNLTLKEQLTALSKIMACTPPPTQSAPNYYETYSPACRTPPRSRESTCPAYTRSPP